jgi:hypothetical protein
MHYAMLVLAAFAQSAFADGGKVVTPEVHLKAYEVPREPEILTKCQRHLLAVKEAEEANYKVSGGPACQHAAELFWGAAKAGLEACQLSFDPTYQEVMREKNARVFEMLGAKCTFSEALATPCSDSNCRRTIQDVVRVVSVARAKEVTAALKTYTDTPFLSELQKDAASCPGKDFANKLLAQARGLQYELAQLKTVTGERYVAGWNFQKDKNGNIILPDTSQNWERTLPDQRLVGEKTFTGNPVQVGSDQSQPQPQPQALPQSQAQAQSLDDGGAAASSGQGIRLHSGPSLGLNPDKVQNPFGDVGTGNTPQPVANSDAAGESSGNGAPAHSTTSDIHQAEADSDSPVEGTGFRVPSGPSLGMKPGGHLGLSYGGVTASDNSSSSGPFPAEHDSGNAATAQGQAQAQAHGQEQAQARAQEQAQLPQGMKLVEDKVGSKVFVYTDPATQNSVIGAIDDKGVARAYPIAGVRADRATKDPAFAKELLEDAKDTAQRFNRADQDAVDRANTIFAQNKASSEKSESSRGKVAVHRHPKKGQKSASLTAKHAKKSGNALAQQDISVQSRAPAQSPQRFILNTPVKVGTTSYFVVQNPPFGYYIGKAVIIQGQKHVQYFSAKYTADEYRKLVNNPAEIEKAYKTTIRTSPARPTHFSLGIDAQDSEIGDSILLKNSSP